MSLSRLKAPSTKTVHQVPAEFEPIFIEHGWHRAEYLFGKRAAKRWFTTLGPDRLRAARAAYRADQRSTGTKLPRNSSGAAR